MTIDILKRSLTFIVLCLAQALVFNHIHLFDCATPLLYVYLVMLFRRNTSRWSILLWSFFLGLSVDMFANTPGVAAASLTFIGLIQPYILDLFMLQDSDDDFEPGLKSMGGDRFFYYVLILDLLYNIVFFTLETFNFFNWIQWLECIGGSTIITVILILVIENLRKK
ncbi:MAG TPA: rod shape-determining protein MreD [Xylanibacter oryzae]|uniref:rod shape-determining protein MreD n=1 Tax=Xylanibacter oryzae TaxID=185293 RepID=UPI0005678DA8|nr:rod shape-determining protein MreD [Xylanibacter oryzae]HRN15840.1 rod shape-determining protein MreD [Xylanibacter oryzae]